MSAMNQRQGKKGRRSDRNSAVRVNKTPLGEDISALLSNTPAGVYNNPTLAHTLVALTGCVVEVQLRSGETYEGVLGAISPNMEISLNVAHVKGKPPTRENVCDQTVKFSEVVTISAKTRSNPQLDIFKTDTEISGRSNGGSQSRELQPFTDFTEEDNGLCVMGSSEESGWSVEDMWAVNQDKFQVSSTYDEELPQYTTPLLRDGENYKQREIEAIKKANEIESKTMYARHGVDDLGSEEDRWSSVVREPLVPDRPQGTSSVAENGGHIRTTSEITPPLQASPITSASSSQAPPPPTTSPLPAPPSSHGDSSSVTSPEPPPSSTPSQSPGNNQTESSDSVNTDEIIDKTNEGITSTISSKNDPNEHTSSIGEPTTYEKDSSIAGSSGSGSQVDLQAVTPQESRGEREGREESGGSASSLTGELAQKEQAIKNFKLDPKAKEFVISSSFISPPLPTSTTPLTSSSPASVQGSPATHHTYTPTRTHTHTPRSSSRFTPRPRPHTPTSGFSHSAIFPDAMIQNAAVSSSYMLTQPAGLLRPGLMQQGFSQYAVPPAPMVGGMVAQGVLPNPQIITANPQMIASAAGSQQQFALGTVTQPPQFIAQPTQSIITPQGVISPAGQPTVYIPNVGVPLSPLPQQMVGMPQVSPVGQTMAGTTAASGLPASGLPRMTHFMQGSGK